MRYLILCSVIWSFSYGLTKGNLAGLNPDFICLFRMMIPFFVFLPFLRLKNLSTKDLAVFLGIGAVQYGAMYFAVLRAYPYLSAYQVVFFTACTPIYVTLLHDLFEKKLQTFYLGAAFLAFSGCAFLYYESLSWNGALKGFLWVQLSDLFFALGQVVYKRFKKNKEYQDSSIYSLVFLGGALIPLLSLSCLGGWQDPSLLSSTQVYTLIYLGAVSSGVCFFWWNRASLQVSAGTLAVFNNLKIPLGVLVSLVFFHETADISKLLLAFVCILGAFALCERHSRKQKFFLRKNVH